MLPYSNPWFLEQDRAQRSRVDKGSVDWRVLCAELCESVVDGLDPCLTEGVLATTAVHISGEGVLGVCRGSEKSMIRARSWAACGR